MIRKMKHRIFATTTPAAASGRPGPGHRGAAPHSSASADPCPAAGKRAIRKLLRKIVPTAVIITGFAAASLPAIPAAAASAPTQIAMNAMPVSPAHVTLSGLGVVPAQAATSTFNICLINARPLMCQKSNGPGNQVTITSNANDWANFLIVRSTLCCGGLSVYQFEDGNGNCLRAGTNHIVKIENGGCASNDSADWWIGAGSGRLESYLYGDLMLTHGAVSGDNVWHAAFVSGDWTDWAY